MTESSQQTPAKDGGGEEAHEEVDEGFDHGAPVNYFGAHEAERGLLVQYLKVVYELSTNRNPNHLPQWR